MRTRVLLGGVGVLLALFGAFRLLTQIPNPDLLELAVWLVAAIVIHDGILSPVMLAVGWATGRLLPARVRAYVQAALIAGALATVVAIPLIYREGSQPRAKAILEQNYGANLTVVLAIITAGCLLAYARRVVLDRRRPSDA